MARATKQGNLTQSTTFHATGRSVESGTRNEELFVVGVNAVFVVFFLSRKMGHRVEC